LCPIFVDRRSFRTGVFRDVFFDNLLESDILKRYEIVIIPVLISATKEQVGMLASWAEEKGFHLMFPVCMVSTVTFVVDVIRSLFHFSYGVSAKEIAGIDVSSLVLWERADDWRLGSWVQVYQIQRVCRLLGNHHTGRRLVIYPFENQFWERVFLYTLRRYANIYAIGIQNAPCPSLSTRFFISRRPSMQYPLPDFLIVNGDISEMMLRPVYGARIDVRKSLLLRPITTYVKRHTDGDKNGVLSMRKRVLVVCSVGIYDAREMIARVLAAFSDSTSYCFDIAVHPLMDPAVLCVRGFPVLPRHIAFAKESMDVLLARADIVLFDSSTVGLQALSMGIPAVFVGHECAVNVDPTEFDESVTFRAYSCAQLRDICDGIARNPRAVDIEERGKKLATRYFGTPSLPTVIDILPPLIREGVPVSNL
jgi:hypothetical protein